jgi:hypothetical protein
MEFPGSLLALGYVDFSFNSFFSHHFCRGMGLVSFKSIAYQPDRCIQRWSRRTADCSLARAYTISTFPSSGFLIYATCGRALDLHGRLHAAFRGFFLFALLQRKTMGNGGTMGTGRGRLLWQCFVRFGLSAQSRDGGADNDTM